MEEGVEMANDMKVIATTSIDGEEPHLHLILKGKSETEDASNGTSHTHDMSSDGSILAAGFDNHIHKSTKGYVS